MIKILEIVKSQTCFLKSELVVIRKSSKYIIFLASHICHLNGLKVHRTIKFKNVQLTTKTNHLVTLMQQHEVDEASAMQGDSESLKNSIKIGIVH